ncbi:MAG: DUF2207 domain-containing protein [Thermodesulfobacteriota bacterium]
MKRVEEFCNRQDNFVYVISYEVENAVLLFDDQDELYWNVTGNDWRAPIEEASAKVSLALKHSSKNLRATCYTGPFGSKESECSYKTYLTSAMTSAPRGSGIGGGSGGFGVRIRTPSLLIPPRSNSFSNRGESFR